MVLKSRRDDIIVATGFNPWKRETKENPSVRKRRKERLPNFGRNVTNAEKNDKNERYKKHTPRIFQEGRSTHLPFGHGWRIGLADTRKPCANPRLFRQSVLQELSENKHLLVGSGTTIQEK